MAGAFKIYYKLPHNFGPDLYFTDLFIFPFHYRAKSTDSEMSEGGLTSNSINFIKEDQTSLLGPGHLEELTHHPGPLHTNGTFSIISGFRTILSVFYFLFNFSFQPPVFFLSETHLSDVLLHQLGANHPDEARVCSVGHGTCTECLPSARWSKQQHALRGLDAQIDKPLGLEDRRQYCSLKIKIKLML